MDCQRCGSQHAEGVAHECYVEPVRVRLGDLFDPPFARPVKWTVHRGDDRVLVTLWPTERCSTSIVMTDEEARSMARQLVGDESRLRNPIGVGEA